jgi:comEA protein
LTSFFTKQEQQFIIFLLFSLFLGLGVKHIREHRSRPDESWRQEKERILLTFQERSQLVDEGDVASPQKPAETKSAISKKNLTEKVNINTATSDELEILPKIGPAMAKRIVEYRTKNGYFQSIDGIQNVKGIGPKTFEIIRDYITVR